MPIQIIKSNSIIKGDAKTVRISEIRRSSNEEVIKAVRELAPDDSDLCLIMDERPDDWQDMFAEVKSFVNERLLSEPVPNPQPMVPMESRCADSAPVKPRKKLSIFKSKKTEPAEYRLSEAAAFPASVEAGLDDRVEWFNSQEILSFGEYLQQLINKKGMTNKDVYFEANLSKQYFSKIINNRLSAPSKEKLLCIAVALKLNMDETKDFLLHAGYAISPYSMIDLVFEYYINKGKYDIYEISFALEELGVEGGLWPELA